MNDLRKQLYETAIIAGMPLISENKCCQLMAWLYIYGGANEQVVFDERLRYSIFYAQKRLNIIGGEIPDQKLLLVLQNYIKSITDYKNPPEWVIDLEKEFKINVLGR